MHSGKTLEEYRTKCKLPTIRVNTQILKGEQDQDMSSHRIYSTFAMRQSTRQFIVGVHILNGTLCVDSTVLIAVTGTKLQEFPDQVIK